MNFLKTIFSLLSIFNLAVAVPQIPTVCSQNMLTISRQATMAVSLLVQTPQDHSHRRSRSTSRLIRSLSTNNSGLFSKKVYDKLKRVYNDILLIEDKLQATIGLEKMLLLKVTCLQLKESLQQEMNHYGVYYEEQGFIRKDQKTYLVRHARAGLNFKGLRTRAEAGLDSIVTALLVLSRQCWL